MKKVFSNYMAVLIFFSFAFTYSAFSAERQALETQISSSQSYTDHTVGFRWVRGFTNLTLGWIDLPHRMIYQNSEVPVFGIVSGLFYGSLVTVWRALSGVSDIMTLGFGGGDIFFAQGMPDFPWNGPWIHKNPPKQEPAPISTQVTITPIPEKTK